MNIHSVDFQEEYRRRFLFYNPSPKQMAFHNAGVEAIERFFSAGNRTGKTYCGTMETAFHLTGRYPVWWQGHRYNHAIVAWVVSKSYQVIRDVLQSLLIGGWNEEEKRYINSGVLDSSFVVRKRMRNNGVVDYLEVKHISGQISTLFFKSYEQGEDMFQGARCHFIHFDEECPYKVYSESKVRLADVDGKGQGRIILTATPLKGRTQMVMYFCKSDRSTDDETILTTEGVIENGKYFVRATWDESPHLSEETKAHLRATTPAYEIEYREKGIPSIASGIIYAIPESEFLIDPIDIKPHWHHCFGMDIGFNPAPTAVVFLAWDKDHDILSVYKEYSATKRTPPDHASILFTMGCDWIPGVCDPSANQGAQRDGGKIIEDYAKAGLKLTKSSYAKFFAHEQVRDRIRSGRFKVFNTCKKFMDEWRSYSTDEDGKVMKGNDHLMNALEFAMCDGLRLAKSKQQIEIRNYYRQSAIGYF